MATEVAWEFYHYDFGQLQRKGTSTDGRKIHQFLLLGFKDPEQARQLRSLTSAEWAEVSEENLLLLESLQSSYGVKRLDYYGQTGRELKLSVVESDTMLPSFRQRIWRSADIDPKVAIEFTDRKLNFFDHKHPTGPITGFYKNGELDFIILTRVASREDRPTLDSILRNFKAIGKMEVPQEYTGEPSYALYHVQTVQFLKNLQKEILERGDLGEFQESELLQVFERMGFIRTLASQYANESKKHPNLLSIPYAEKIENRDRILLGYIIDASLEESLSLIQEFLQNQPLKLCDFDENSFSMARLALPKTYNPRNYFTTGKKRETGVYPVKLPLFDTNFMVNKKGQESIIIYYELEGSDKFAIQLPLKIPNGEIWQILKTPDMQFWLLPQLVDTSVFLS